VPHALEHVERLVEACDLDLLADAARRADPELERAALERITARCRSVRPGSAAHARRLEHELAVIEALRLARYFAAALEVADEARRRGIPVRARGSAVSSLVVHSLGLSPIDPVEHHLMFERFVHAERAEPPDIDLDVAHDRRDELIGWLHAHYGAEHVSPIASYATWQRRSAYRAALAALGAPRAEIDRTLGALPGDELDLPVKPELLPQAHRAAQPIIERLIGRPAHLSVHASGLVISERPLSGFVPFARAPKARVTQYDGQSLEALGLLKLDLLGNRALTERARTLDSADPNAPLPFDDAATWATLRRADTVACFQVETPIVRTLLLEHPVSSLETLAAVLARARPGPASDSELIYEEDLIRRIASALSCSLAHADTWRRAIVRGEADERSFLERAERAGLAPAQAQRTWRELARFVAYAFSKAHALSFAQLAYDSAYLKTHHTAAFACAVLDHHGGMYPLRTLVSDFQRCGVAFCVPSVQRSLLGSMLHDGVVAIGLDHVKHLTVQTKRRILAARPFVDLADVIERTRPKPIELRALIRSGACDGLAPLSRADFPFAHDFWLQQLAVRGPSALAEPAPSFKPASAGDAARVPAYRALVRVQAELELLGMHVSDHPMRVLRSEAQRVSAVAGDRLASHVGQRVRFAGLLAALRRALTSRTQVMCFATFEDEHGLVEAVLPPEALATLDEPIRNPGPYLVTGRVRDHRGAVLLMVEHVMPFYRREPSAMWLALGR
jgi:DNA polymerase III alpha subunit